MEISVSDGVKIAEKLVTAAIPELTQFVCRVEGAAAVLTAAHTEEGNLSTARAAIARQRGHHSGWQTLAVAASATRLQEIIVVLKKHHARGATAEADDVVFNMLAPLTPVSAQLVALAVRDRSLAFKRLVELLDTVQQQFVAIAKLVNDDLGTESIAEHAAKPRPTLTSFGANSLNAPTARSR
jgi:hypothetical protein